jgi:hypothetical protein
VSRDGAPQQGFKTGHDALPAAAQGDLASLLAQQQAPRRVTAQGTGLRHEVLFLAHSNGHAALAVAQ